MCKENIAWKKCMCNRKTCLNFVICRAGVNVDRIETLVLAFLLSEEEQKMRNHPARE